MKAIVLPRAVGKTTRMLTWLRENPDNVLVVFSERERERLVRTLYQEDLDLYGQVEPKKWVSRVRHVNGIIDGLFRGLSPRNPIYGIDELDQVLFSILHGGVEVVSFTGEVEMTTGAKVRLRRTPRPTHPGTDQEGPVR